MGLYVIGVNYKTAPVQVREKFSISAEEHEGVLDSIKKLPNVSECSLLSTCNRTEIHVFSENPLPDTGYIESYFCNLKGLDIYNAKKYFYVYEGEKAIRHVFNLASGMDSMLLGEDQILGQFKKAYEVSMKQGTSKSVLNTLSRLAVTASKKIKTRNIALGKASSVAGQVGELLLDIFGAELASKKVLIIGSGKIGQMVRDELMQMGVAGICMTKRSNNADEAINDSKVKYVSYNERYSYMDSSDIVIGATTSPHYTVTKDILDEIIIAKDRIRVFIDLAVPRDFDEAISHIEGVSLYNIDTIKKFTGSSGTKGNRKLDVHYIQEQINCYTDEFTRWFQHRNKLCGHGEA